MQTARGRSLFRMNQAGILACCAVCNQQTYRRCSRCLSIYYCNTEHQRQDWRRHKRNCGPKLPKQGSKNDKLVEPFANIEDLAKIEEQRELIASSVNQIIQQTDVQKQETATETRRSKKAKRKNSKKERGVIVNDSKHNSQVRVENIGLGGNNLLNANEYNIPGPSLIRNSSVISSVVYTNKDLTKESAITYEGSSEQEILSESAQQLSTVEFVNSSNVLRAVNATERMPMLPGYESDTDPSSKGKVYPEASLRDSNAPFNYLLSSYYMDPTDPYYEVCHRLIKDMTQYGVCVLDNFLGRERGLQVLNEVLTMYRSGIFTAGRLVSNPGSTEARTVRSDRITWIDGKEPHCTAIRLLINQVDNIVLRANKVAENGKMGDYVINGRTKAMVACYPGLGSHYVKHVDNPNKDGRCITAIYYLNLDWDVKRCGGLLRVFPEGTNQVADIAPIFDRMLFFWSDRRNPHEVQPAYDTRYAITLWYFDAHEREEALLNFKERAQPSSSK